MLVSLNQKFLFKFEDFLDIQNWIFVIFSWKWTIFKKTLNLVYASLITLYALFQIFPMKNMIFDFDDRIQNINKIQLKFKRQKDIRTIVLLQIAQNGKNIIS